MKKIWQNEKLRSDKVCENYGYINKDKNDKKEFKTIVIKKSRTNIFLLLYGRHDVIFPEIFFKAAILQISRINIFFTKCCSAGMK